MKKFILALAFVSLVWVTNRAQTPTPTPIEADEDVVKISTTLIQVDVTVTDKNGKIITDIKPEEIEIFENGVKQNITNFSFVAAASAPAETAVAPKTTGKNTAAPPPTAALKPGQVRRTIALVVDDLGLSFESVYQVRRALRKFVDEQMQPTDLVAVIRTGSGMGALQQFTSNKRQLYAAIEAVKWNSYGRAGISAFAPLEATPGEIQQAMGDNTITAEDLEDEANSIRSQNDFREDIFSIGTLGAINFIVKGMDELPGRKSIMLFSDGFGICSPGNPDRCGRILESVRQLTDLSNRAAVSIYSFDARGLQTTGLTAADNTSGISPERMRNTVNERSAIITDNQEGLAYLAEETGGRTFFNTNDINRGLEKALEDQKGYYLLGYEPDEATFDPKIRRFNKIEIRVSRKDAKARYRSGFFGVADEAIKKSAVTQNATQQVYAALTSPFAVSDISLRLNTLYGDDKTRGAFVRSLLHINAKDLKFTDEPDGRKKVVFDILAFSFGENGTVVDQVSQTATWIGKGAEYQKILDEGFVGNFMFPVKKPGAYQYRVAIRDSQSGKIGSANQFIEIPNLRKNRLTVSSLILENLTAAEWQKLSEDAAARANVPDSSLGDTSLRRFKRGSVLRYGYEVYNARPDASQKPNLSAQVRIFRDGKLILEGVNAALDASGQTDLQRIKTSGALSLGDTLKAGDYVLQIVVTDNLAKKKRQIAAQFVQFEIVE